MGQPPASPRCYVLWFRPTQSIASSPTVGSVKLFGIKAMFSRHRRRFIPFLYKLLEEDGLQDKEYIAVLLATIAEGEPPFLNCATDAVAATQWRAIFTKRNESLDEKIGEARAIAAEIQRQLTRRPDLLSRCMEVSASAEPMWLDS